MVPSVKSCDLHELGSCQEDVQLRPARIPHRALRFLSLGPRRASVGLAAEGLGWSPAPAHSMTPRLSHRIAWRMGGSVQGSAVHHYAVFPMH